MAQTVPDYENWDATASMVENTLATSEPSDVFLTELRAQITSRRQIFLDAQATNASRIATLADQIAALGPTPTEGGEEAPEITKRRADLQARVDELNVPRLRATEAFQRADGLINEIDAMLSARKAQSLLKLGPTPADIRIWPVALSEIWESGVDAVDGVSRAWNTPLVRTAAKDRAPIIIVFLLLAFLLITQGRRWSERFADGLSKHENSASYGFSAFIVSLGQVGFPLLGFVLLGLAWQNTSFFGTRISQILDAFPWIAVLIFGSAWLATRVFPKSEAGETPIIIPMTDRLQARLLVFSAGVIMALHVIFQIFNKTDRYSDEAVAISAFVLVGLGALCLFGIGRSVQRHEPQGENKRNATAIKRTGQLSMLIGVAGIVLATIGYTGAATALVFPTLLSLGLLATMLLVFEAIRDLFAVFSLDSEAGHDGLAAVGVNAVLILLSIPLFALIWGARASDLSELWIRFKSGVTLGDVQISPGAFLALITVFIIGYLVTRLIQRTLKNRILPKTKMDMGTRNAMVSGFGYIGIFIAALIAITSAGLDLSSLAIVAGALSVGIGFGLQNIVSNFVSGIILLIERPISEGDWIEVGGNMGIVKNISVRSTRIETFDRSDVIVPNADLVSGTVTNYTRGNAVGRIIVPVGVAYGNDTRKVQELLQPIAEGHPMVLLDPPPAVIFQGFGADSLNFEVRALLRDINFGLTVKSEMNHQIAEALTANGIEIPFAQRDIWIRNPEALTGSS